MSVLGAIWLFCIGNALGRLLFEVFRFGRQTIRNVRSRRRHQEALEELAQNLTKDGAILLFYDRMHGLDYPLPKERRNAQ